MIEEKILEYHNYEHDILTSNQQCDTTKKQTKDAIDYIQSDIYSDDGLPFDIHKRKLAEKAIK